MKNVFLCTILAISALFLTTGCDNDDPVPTPLPVNNIVELAIDNGFTSLASALTRADLVDVLQGDGPFTVFAPTNEAFTALLAEIGQSSIDDIPAEVLKEILLYHVVSGTVMSEDISAGDVFTVQGTTVSLSVQNGISINSANVISPFDVEASNGVIHTIDQVLVPESIAQFVNTVLEPAYFNESFTTLIESAAKAGLVETLLTTPNLTIFAPNNAAFEASGIDPAQINAEDLGNVLKYHVVASKVLSAEIPRQATTLAGSEIFFSLTDAGAFINGNTAIIATDIESGTGVVHVLGQVVIPPIGNIVETAVDLSSSGEFTSLVAALQRTATEGTPEQNLIGVLSGNGPFTVFAPTNAAFEALLNSISDWDSLDDIPLETLIQVLTYHVVTARAYDQDLPAALDANNQLKTAQGSNLSFDLTQFTINGTTKIIAINTHATNGVIHIIDQVLLPS